MHTPTIALVSGLALAMAMAPPALAKSPKKEGKAAFKEGTKLAKEGKHKEALEQLLKAHELASDLKVVQAAVASYDALDDPQGAAELLGGVVESGKPKKAAKWAAGELPKYKEKLAAKEKEAAAAKAKAEAEDKRKAAEAAKAKAEAEAKRQAEEEEARQAEEEEARQAEASRAAEEAEKRAATKRLIAYSAAGVAVLAAGGATYFWMDRVSEQDAANDCVKKAPTCTSKTWQDHKDAGQSADTMQLASWGVAGAAAATAATFYVLAMMEEPAPVPAPGPALPNEVGEDEEGGGDDEAGDDADGGEGEGDDSGDDDSGDDAEEPETSLLWVPGGAVLRITF